MLQQTITKNQDYVDHLLRHNPDLVQSILNPRPAYRAAIGLLRVLYGTAPDQSAQVKIRPRRDIFNQATETGQYASINRTDRTIDAILCDYQKPAPVDIIIDYNFFYELIEKGSRGDFDGLTGKLRLLNYTKQEYRNKVTINGEHPTKKMVKKIIVNMFSSK
jgi:hypothetical protein